MKWKLLKFHHRSHLLLIKHQPPRYLTLKIHPKGINMPITCNILGKQRSLHHITNAKVGGHHNFANNGFPRHLVLARLTNSNQNPLPKVNHHPRRTQPHKRSFNHKQSKFGFQKGNPHLVHLNPTKSSTLRLKAPHQEKKQAILKKGQ